MRGKSHREQLGVLRAGQDLVTAGYIGEKAVSRIIKERKAQLLTRYSETFLEEPDDSDISHVWEAAGEAGLAFWKEFGVTEAELVEDGGIMTALWNLSGAYQVGIGVYLTQIPARQRTIEVCEFYDLNPYRLYSGNCWVLACDSGWQTVERLKKLEIPAVVIGSVNSGLAREIYNGEGKAYMERPREDEIEKLFKNGGAS